MRWREIIAEASEGHASGAAGGGGSGKKHPFNTDQKHAIPSATRYPDTPAHYYDMYRFGVHMAGSPDGQEFDPSGPSGNEMVTLAYSKADLDIIKKSAKEMGLKGISLSSAGSKEQPDTYTQSPVAKWK